MLQANGRCCVVRLQVLVMANEFPYYCQEGVGHFNIWSSGAPLTDEQVRPVVYREVC